MCCPGEYFAHRRATYYSWSVNRQGRYVQWCIKPTANPMEVSGNTVFFHLLFSLRQWIFRRDATSNMHFCNLQTVMKVICFRDTMTNEGIFLTGRLLTLTTGHYSAERLPCRRRLYFHMLLHHVSEPSTFIDSSCPIPNNIQLHPEAITPPYVYPHTLRET